MYAFTSFASFHSIFISIRLQVVKKLNAHYLAFLFVARNFGLFIIRSFFLSV